MLTFVLMKSEQLCLESQYFPDYGKVFGLSTMDIGCVKRTRPCIE